MKNKIQSIERNKLIEKIYKYFPENFILLHEKELFALNSSRSEVNFYYKKTWKEALKKKENIYGSDLSFLTPKAISYYLPAFMIYCIEDPDNADELLDRLLSFLLNLCNDLELYLWTEKRRQTFLKYLSSDQKDIVELYIEYMFQEYPEDFLFILQLRSIGK